MTQAEVDSLKEGDELSLMGYWPAELASTPQRSFRGRVDMVTENYICVSWPAAHKSRGDILLRTSPVWEAMVKR